MRIRKVIKNTSSQIKMLEQLDNGLQKPEVNKCERGYEMTPGSSTRTSTL